MLSPKEVKEYGQSIIDMFKILSKPHLVMGTLGFSNKYIKRRIIMISRFKKKSITWTIAALAFAFMVGCSSTSKNQVTTTPKDPAATDTPFPTTSPKPASSSTPQQDNSQNTILENIKKLAVQGKVINCDFAVDSMIIDDVIAKWGEPDKSDYVGQAKGSYSTYSKHNLVFGWNKGLRIFEVRSFDNKLNKISLSMTKNFFGTPAYDVKSNGQEIIGYVSTKDYKILLVFPQATEEHKDPLMDHYSVLYPKGTTNLMADDPGREW